MQRMLATPADAEIILKLYDLRRETVMRQARAWVIGEFWPTTPEEVFAVTSPGGNPQHSAYLRQVTTYWEMAAAMVVHGALSPDLFVDCNAEGFFLLAKFSPLLAGIRERMPSFLSKTSELVERLPSAAARYEVVRKNVENRRMAMQRS